MKKSVKVRLAAMVLAVVMILSLVQEGPMEVQAASVSATKAITVKTTASGVKISWEKVLKASGYVVYRKAKGAKKWTKAGIVKKQTKTTYMDKKAVSGKVYSYCVKAYRKSGSKKIYSKKRVSKSIRYLKAPSVTVKAQKKSIQVTWEKTKGATGYIVYRKMAGAKKWVKVGTVKKQTTTSYTDKKAVSGKSYSYKVKAYYKKGKTKAYSATKTSKSASLGSGTSIGTSADRGISIKTPSDQGTSVGTPSDCDTSEDDSNKPEGYVDVTDYTYEIIPLLAPFDDYFYVKTDNPKPNYVQFVDRESVYYTDEQKAEETPCAIRPTSRRFSDVVYEDYETGRVKGGYIFVRDTGYGMDGGELVLQQGNKEYSKTYYSWGSTEAIPDYTDTNVTVSCPKVMSYTQYLIDEYTTEDADLFTNLDSIQRALDKLALYPKNVLDTSEQTGYPFLATSPYYELELNAHYSIYNGTDPMLALWIYPYLLDSLRFPSTILTVAKMLEPDCTVTGTDVHYMIQVTYNGESECYGGAGEGTVNSLHNKYVEKLYTFDGTSSDFAYNGTLSRIADKYAEYQTSTEADLDAFKSALTGDIFDAKTSGGTWIRVAIEGGSGSCYTYITSTDGTKNSYSVSDTWVDGRYVTIYNQFYKGVKFGDTYSYSNGEVDTGKSSILIRNVTFTDKYGETVTRDLLYRYDSSSDTWKATSSYLGGNYYSANITLPDNMVLTREEVNTMLANGELDGNTDKDPESGLIYDGTAEPGTPFTQTTE